MEVSSEINSIFEEEEQKKGANIHWDLLNDNPMH